MAGPYLYMFGNRSEEFLVEYSRGLSIQVYIMYHTV